MHVCVCVSVGDLNEIPSYRFMPVTHLTCLVRFLLLEATVFSVLKYMVYKLVKCMEQCVHMLIFCCHKMCVRLHRYMLSVTCVSSQQRQRPAPPLPWWGEVNHGFISNEAHGGGGTAAPLNF